MRNITLNRTKDSEIMSNYRIPRTDADMADYLNQTMPYLKQPYLPEVSQEVEPESTLTLHVGNLPPYLAIRFQNTGGVGDPALMFCLSETEEGTCPAAGSLLVPAGVTESRTVQGLGNPLLLYLNVTNADPSLPAPFTVTYSENWQRLGLMEEQLTEWEMRGKAWLLKYADAQDDSKRTPDVVASKNTLAEAFIAFAEPVLTLIAGSPNIVQADYSKFNIAPPNKQRNPKPPIVGTPYTGMRPLAGGGVQFRSRVFADATLASLHPDADALEMRWALLPHDAPAPQSPAECPHLHVSTKAMFTMAFGVENAGMRLHCYLRWANLREPHKSGLWNQRLTLVLTD